MKISITGHTAGIGLALKTVFEKNGHTVVGFSRSNGYQIADEEARARILEESKDVDMFINNAYDHVGQYELLAGMINQWDGTNKQIINISSKFSLAVNRTWTHEFLDVYIEKKREQNELIRTKMAESSPRILNVIVGLVDTNKSTELPGNRINPKDLSELIYNLAVNSPMYVQEITLDAPDNDWHKFGVF